MTLEEAYLFFEHNIIKLSKTWIPVYKNTRKRNIWMNTDIYNLIRLKKQRWRAYSNNKNTDNYKLYVSARNLVTSHVKLAKRNLEYNVINQIKDNPKHFWKYIQDKTSLTDKVQDLIKPDGSMTSGDSEKSEVLNNQFSSVFTSEDISNIPKTANSPITNIDSLEITEQNVYDKLSGINCSKSAGPDQIHPRVLKEIRNNIFKPLTLLFNRSLYEGVVPSSWKKANISPIYKQKGSKSDPSNYRPISLTSCISKLLESLIRDHIMNYLNNNHLLSDDQFGFRSHRSCQLQLLKVMEQWADWIDNKKQIDVIYLDFLKAFDTVPHMHLLTKLEAFGIKGKLLDWIGQFLLDRKQRVTIKDKFSSWSNVKSGIPQGSVLGPILFIMYINDLPNTIKCCLKIFADDTKIYKDISVISDKHMLQSDLDELFHWSNLWKIKFNINKCKYLAINKKSHEFNTINYNINKIKLMENNREKDLGILFDSKLTFEHHIEDKIRKASRLLGLIKRAFTYLDSRAWVTIYKCLIRPILEYGNCIIYPKTITLQTRLENVQRKFTKCIPELKFLAYEERLKKLKILSLHDRRIRGDLIQAFKIMKGFDDIQPTEIFTFSNISTRGHGYKIIKSHSSTEIKRQAFSNRILEPWNALPEYCVNSITINQFKNRLDKHLQYT